MFHTRLTRLPALFCAVLALFWAGRASAQLNLSSLDDGLGGNHTQVKLLLPVTDAKPGDTILAGVQLTMDPGWHTYWRNPGDAGTATTIQWQLPAGVTADPIQWPLPHKLPPVEVTTYGYQGDALLLVPLHLATNLPAGPLNLAAKVAWLECKETCIPAKQDISATLTVGPESKSSLDAALIESGRAKLARTDNLFTFACGWETTAKGDQRNLIITGRQTAKDVLPVEKADFFPDANDAYEIQSATETIPDQSGFRLRKVVKKYSGDWPKTISGLVVIEGNSIRSGFDITLPVADTAPAAATTSGTSTPTSPATPEKPLGLILLYAFIGGLILNIMPCVLPVIALKILGFVNEGKSDPRRVRALGGIYAIGVLLSFLALAAVVIGLKSAGHLVGWGVQFGSPVFVISLTILVTLVAMNLFGLFEVTLGDHAADVAGNLSSKQGAAGALFNGVLATALATPCTAPFLGYALGFAFAQPPAMIILIFLTSGLGLAAPYLVLSWNPAWLKFLPKPGVWMEKFKIAMGFPVLGTAVWLFTLASGDLDKTGTLRLGLFLIALALAAWVWGEFVQRGTKRRALAGIISLLLISGFGAYAYFQAPDEIHWQPWSPDTVAQSRAAGKPVLVDFTADWCLTCQVNKKTSLEVPTVRARLNSLGAVALVGDYTHTPETITAELAKYHRAGVPLVLVFPAATNREAIVLPEILTPGLVLDALNQAAK